MSTFEQLYRPATDVDDALRPLLHGLYDELQRMPPQLPQLQAAIIAVLEFLASPRGRTDANCSAVDSFLMRDETWDGDRLPQPFVDVLADMAGALHDTISAPDIAANFESTPEQLLERARRL
jgi:hypothetical protein